VVQKISLIEITSTCSAATSCGCRSSGVFCDIDSATLQPVHRCTPAPYGMLAAPAALPTGMTITCNNGLCCAKQNNTSSSCFVTVSLCSRYFTWALAWHHPWWCVHCSPEQPSSLDVSNRASTNWFCDTEERKLNEWWVLCEDTLFCTQFRVFQMTASSWHKINNGCAVSNRFLFSSCHFQSFWVYFVKHTAMTMLDSTTLWSCAFVKDCTPLSQVFHKWCSPTVLVTSQV